MTLATTDASEDTIPHPTPLTINKTVVNLVIVVVTYGYPWGGGRV